MGLNELTALINEVAGQNPPSVVEPIEEEEELMRSGTECHYIIRKYVSLIWSEHNYTFSHRIVHTTTCFGPVYWPSSGCNINLISSYTVCAWGTVGETRSRLTDEISFTQSTHAHIV